MSKIRCFIAISIPQSEQKTLASAVGRLAPPSNVMPTEFESLHLTLNFIGDVDDRETPELCQRISRRTTVRPFEMKLGELGSFPLNRNPRVLWVGVTRGNEELAELNSAYQDELERFGFIQEKRFTPHITLARIKHYSASVEDYHQQLKSRISSARFQPFRVENITVFNSVLDRSGATHVPLSTIRMGG